MKKSSGHGVTPPTGVELYKSEIATYWLDDEGVLNSISNSVVRTVENVTASMALVKGITKDRRVPHIAYLSTSPVPDQATRNLVARELPNLYTAMAMVSQGGLGEVIMNILFKLKKPPIPMKSFATEQPARVWLQQFKNPE